MPNLNIGSIPDKSALVEDRLLEVVEYLRAKAAQNVILKSYPFQNNHLNLIDILNYCSVRIKYASSHLPDLHKFCSS